MRKKVKILLIFISVILLGIYIYRINSSTITLGKYKNLQTGLKVETVTDDAINNVIDELVTNMGGCYKEAQKNIEEGDRVDISYHSVNEDESAPFEMSLIIGDSNYPAEFSKAILGKTIGDSAEATLSGEAGSETYKLTINRVYEKADLTDEFVAGMKIDNVKTVSDLRKNVSDYLKTQYEQVYNDAQKDAVLKIVLDDSKVKDIPEDLVVEYQNMITDKINATIESCKKSTEDGKKINKLSLLEDEMKENQFTGSVDEYIRWYAEKDAKEYLIFSKIAKKENIKVEDKELYSALASDWQKESDKFPTLLDYMESCPLQQYERAILCDKVLTFIAESSEDGLYDSSKNKSDISAINASSK
ncbi:hypothetical protein [Butyrivibrio sp. AE2005]|uniref:hypothetical protein n=1 Tax=Butyrivibrio sp. AE2005 TaxID=1496722 RepID=UPI00047C2271|nr:hypothetical protein [Butyrivibrio sp. AE2005]